MSRCKEFVPAIFCVKSCKDKIAALCDACTCHDVYYFCSAEYSKLIYVCMSIILLTYIHNSVIVPISLQVREGLADG
jgi:hypothetical protein